MLGTRMLHASAAPAPRLLDEHPGAALAYSVRLLRNGYIGAALRVRRSSDNAEQDIGFTAEGDLDESALTSFVGANDGVVTTWYDQSGNARDATQATASKQPRIVVAGVVQKEHSWPAVIGETDKTLDSGFSGLTDKTIFAVVNTDSSAGTNARRILSGYVGSGSIGDEMNLDVFSGDIRFSDGGVGLTETSHIVGAHLYYAMRNASELQLAFDGNAPLAGGTPNANANSETYHLVQEDGGVLTEYSKTYQEIVVYPNDRSASRAEIEADINDYYSVF